MDPLKRTQTDNQAAKLLRAWETLRLLHREVPAQAVTVLLYVAAHNPCHKQAIEEDLGLTTASCSRCIDFLKVQGPRRPSIVTRSIGLITKYRDPSNGRRFLLKLSDKGERLLTNAKETLYD